MSPPAAVAAPGIDAPGSRRRRDGLPSAPRERRAAPARRAAARRLLGAVSALWEHRLLDRLIRGRVWIGLLAFALIGIVTLQLGLLKLNGEIGRALEHEAQLQRQNATLSIENSELASDENVLARAASIGMASVPLTALRFLGVRPSSDPARAAGILAAPARPGAARASEGGNSEGTASGAAISAEGASSGESSASALTSASSQAIAAGEGAPSSSSGAGAQGAGSGEGAGSAEGAGSREGGGSGEAHSATPGAAEAPSPTSPSGPAGG